MPYFPQSAVPTAIQDVVGIWEKVERNSAKVKTWNDLLWNWDGGESEIDDARGNWKILFQKYY